MRCPTLSDLPPPPPGKTGWPWTEECPQLPDTRSDGSAWPRISIVTPSYNQGQFIEETIRSILLQGYPKLEYIIMDGGSTDESLEIIRKYAPWFNYWQSKPDAGQAAAISEGVSLSHGCIIHWINSDDFLLKGALKIVAELGVDGNSIAATAVVNFRDGNFADSRIVENSNLSLSDWCKGKMQFHQPGVWLHRTAWDSASRAWLSCSHAFDVFLLFEILTTSVVVRTTSEATVCFRLHNDSKTVSQSGRFSFDMRILIAHALRTEKFGPWRRCFTRARKAIALRRLISIRARRKRWIFLPIAALLRLEPSISNLRYSIGALRRAW